MPIPQGRITVCETVNHMHREVDNARMSGQTIGCVPTMGYLHEGHASLIREAANKHPFVVVSIFVNPTQFGPSEDFERYPRDLERDMALLRQAGATHLFLPSVHEMYPDGVQSSIHIDGVTEVLEGAARPTHFDGVATVVSKLFQAMKPDEAFFGQKDLQQTLVIKKLVATSAESCVRETRITVLPTIRESDGLAMSSRNVYLSLEHRSQATIIYRTLCAACDAIRSGETRGTAIEDLMRDQLASVPNISIDYAVAVDAETLRSSTTEFIGPVALCIAVRLGTTRLIDNMLVEPPTA